MSLYCIASAKYLTCNSKSHSISAIVLHNFITLCISLGDNVNLFAAIDKKSLAAGDNDTYLSISLGHISALDEIFVPLNLSFWIDQAFDTFHLIDSLLSHFVSLNKLSIFSLGISNKISILSINGPEIFD